MLSWNFTIKKQTNKKKKFNCTIERLACEAKHHDRKKNIQKDGTLSALCIGILLDLKNFLQQIKKRSSTVLLIKNSVFFFHLNAFNFALKNSEDQNRRVNLYVTDEILYVNLNLYNFFFLFSIRKIDVLQFITIARFLLFVWVSNHEYHLH